MDRKSLTFSAVVALSITLNPIPITAQRRGGRPSAGSQKTPDNRNQANNPATVTREQYERDIRALSDELKAIREETTRANQTRTKEEQSWRFGERAPVWSNWVLALIAGIAGWVAYRAFTHERDAVRLTQRADVLVDS